MGDVHYQYPSFVVPSRGYSPVMIAEPEIWIYMYRHFLAGTSYSMPLASLHCSPYWDFIPVLFVFSFLGHVIDLLPIYCRLC